MPARLYLINPGLDKNCIAIILRHSFSCIYTSYYYLFYLYPTYSERYGRGGKNSLLFSFSFFFFLFDPQTLYHKRFVIYYLRFWIITLRLNLIYIITNIITTGAVLTICLQRETVSTPEKKNAQLFREKNTSPTRTIKISLFPQYIIYE